MMIRWWYCRWWGGQNLLQNILLRYAKDMQQPIAIIRSNLRDTIEGTQIPLICSKLCGCNDCFFNCEYWTIWQRCNFWSGWSKKDLRQKTSIITLTLNSHKKYIWHILWWNIYNGFDFSIPKTWVELVFPHPLLVELDFQTIELACGKALKMLINLSASNSIHYSM